MSIPVLFLHGWAMSGATFDHVVQRLGPDYDCHAPDLPGHGENTGQAASLDRCAEHTKRCVDALDRPVLVGWSMGAAIAWRYIAQHGTSRLRGVVTIDMSPRMLPDHDWDYGLLGQSRADILATPAKVVPRWPRMVNTILRNMYAPNAPPALRGPAMQAFLRAQNPEHLRPLWQDLTQMDARATIAQIDIPYLVCTGRKSRLYPPAVGQWIQRTAPQAREHRFERSGHSPHLEEPDAFVDALWRFMAVDCAPKHKTPDKTTRTDPA